MFSNLKSTLKKVIIIFLIIALTYANFVLVGNNIVKGLISYASDETGIGLKEQLITEQELVTNKVYEIDGEEKRVVQIELTTGVNSKEYPLKETNIVLKTNIINETLEDVKITNLNKNSYTKGTWTVEGEEIKINLVNENEKLTQKEEGLDKLLVTYIFQYNKDEKVEYIEKAIKSVAIKTYANSEASRTFEGGRYEEIELENDILTLNIENKDIHKTTIKDGKVTYTENLKLDFGYRKDISIFEIKDEINDIYNGEEVNEEIAKKYVKTIMNKEDLENLLKEEGFVTVFDAENEKTLVKITKEYIEGLTLGEKTEVKIKDDEESQEELRAYITVDEENITIEYVSSISKLQIKFENIAKQSENDIENAKFEIKNEKEISNITDTNNIDYLLEKVKYTLGEEEKETESKITFKDTITKATVAVDNTKWEVGKTNQVNYTITLDTTSEKTDLFVNPIFLLEMPKNVEVNTANSKFTIVNNNGAFTGKKVFVTTVLGQQYVAIVLEGAQTKDTIVDGNAQINLSLELNVKENANTEDVATKLYYQNSGVTAYESGMGFDSAQVDVSLVLKNEEQEEIGEEDADDNVTINLNSITEKIVKQEEKIEYIVYIDNYKTKEIKNLQLKDALPEGITLQDVVELTDYDGESILSAKEQKIEYEYDSDTRTLLVNIEKLSPANNSEDGENAYLIPSTKVLKIVVKTDKLNECYSKEIKNQVELILENKKLETNEVIHTVSDAFLEINLQKLEDKIYENQKVKFRINVTNKGLFDAKQKKYKVNASENIELLNAKYGFVEDGKETEVGTSTSSSDKYEQTLIDIPMGKTFYIELEAIIKKQENTNEAQIIGDFDGQEVKWKIGDIEDEEKPDVPGEPGNPEIPKEPDTPIEPTDPINPDEPTKPDNPEKPNEPANPDNPEKPDEPNKPTIPDEERTEGFDLSLKQYLSKITVTNSQGTTTYDYENTNFAKIEIPAKYMNGSTVTLEYKIIVGNAGTISGYARKIVDYLPEGLNFSSETNPDWYKGDDGNLYSVALMDKLLEPGQTEELKIVLTKNMNNNNTGTITNVAEIYEASNDENVEDINSIPGDKIEGQNDMSKVEVIIAVKTGRIALYVVLTMLVLAILGFGINKVRKVTLKDKGGY